MTTETTILTGWRTANLGEVAEINPESLGPDTPASYQFQYIDISSVTAGVIDWNATRTHQLSAAPSRARRVVRPKDVLLCTVRPGLQAHAYADWEVQNGYVCSTGFAVIRARDKVDSRFLFHLVFSETVTEQVRRREIGSNYPAIGELDVRRLRIPVPPLLEQRRIAAILDSADEAIDKTEALISKLKQAKTGLMHDLFTRGIDERGHLRDPEHFKDSQIGQVPEVWKVQKVEDSAEILDHLRVPINAEERAACQGDVPYYGANGLQGYIDRPLFNEPLILVAEDGGNFEDFATRPIAYRISGPSWVNNHAHIMRPAAGVNFSYLFFSLEHKDVRRYISGGTRSKLTQAELRSVEVAMPPLEEQCRIAEVLDAHEERIRAEEAYRDKLVLQKRGLMDDLLTGRVRVNGGGGGNCA